MLKHIPYPSRPPVKPGKRNPRREPDIDSRSLLSLLSMMEILQADNSAAHCIFRNL
jgi:hypothetical protein